MNPRVTAVQPLAEPHAGRVLALQFSDGTRRLFDMQPFLKLPVFEPLNDRRYFERAHVDHGTVQWPGGLDFDPDTLYLDSQLTKEAQT
jgi:Protein of unknown function (DUF2442)